MANAMSRMRCSRHSGVIFLAMITAIAWPTPHHRLRRSLSSRRSLLVSASANYRHPPCLIITPNHTPVAADSAAGRRACAARPKGKYSRERMALAPIRARRIFPATGAGGAAGGQGHSQFNSINFYVTHRFFVTFFPEESNVPPVPPVPSFLPLVTPSRTARPRTCRACAPWSGRSARPRRPRWSAHSGWDQNPSPWP